MSYGASPEVSIPHQKIEELINNYLSWSPTTSGGVRCFMFIETLPFSGGDASAPADHSRENRRAHMEVIKGLFECRGTLKLLSEVALNYAQFIR